MYRILLISLSGLLERYVKNPTDQPKWVARKVCKNPTDQPKWVTRKVCEESY